MQLTQLIVLAVLQSLTAIFPVGTEGHMALVGQFLRWPDAGPGFALATHTGFLLGVSAYFWRDLADVTLGVIRAAKGKRNPDARLALQLAVASVVTLGAGLAFEHYVAGDWQTPRTMAWAVFGGALALLLFDRMCMTVNRVEHAGFADAIVVSLGQVVALVPGAGGLGVSMTLARLLGYERRDAARFSFLLMIPVAAAVIVRDAYRLLNVMAAVSNTEILCGVVSFFAALIGIAILMTWLRRSTFTLFVIYRLLLAGAVLGFAYGVVAL